MKKPTPTEIGHAHAYICASSQGQLWLKKATFAFEKVAKAWHGDFIAKDIRDAIGTRVPEPSDQRAWGAITLRLKKTGKIIAVGTTKPPHVHGCRITIWRWVRNPKNKQPTLFTLY